MNFDDKEDFNYTTVPINRATDQSPNTELDDEEILRRFEIREQDRWLPLANVGRVMKQALPQQAKLSKDAKMCVQECVSEFISFITSGAVDKCQAEKRKTLNGEDILYALNSLGFENYAEVLKIYLAKYREHESIDAEDRREKDKIKRLIRKERKEREMRKRNSENDIDNDIEADNDDNTNSENGEEELDYAYSHDDMAEYVLNSQPEGIPEVVYANEQSIDF